MIYLATVFLLMFFGLALFYLVRPENQESRLRRAELLERYKQRLEQEAREEAERIKIVYTTNGQTTTELLMNIKSNKVAPPEKLKKKLWQPRTLSDLLLVGVHPDYYTSDQVDCPDMQSPSEKE